MLEHSCARARAHKTAHAIGVIDHIPCVKQRRLPSAHGSDPLIFCYSRRHNKVSVPFLLPFRFLVVLPFLLPFTTVPFFSGVTVFVTVSHRLQPFRFTVQREVVSAELEGI